MKKKKIHAQRKFAQNAKLPTLPQVPIAATERRQDDIANTPNSSSTGSSPNTATQSKQTQEVFTNDTQAATILDYIAFRCAHILDNPVVLLRRLEDDPHLNILTKPLPVGSKIKLTKEILKATNITKNMRVRTNVMCLKSHRCCIIKRSSGRIKKKNCVAKLKTLAKNSYLRKARALNPRLKQKVNEKRRGNYLNPDTPEPDTNFSLEDYRPLTPSRPTEDESASLTSSEELCFLNPEEGVSTLSQGEESSVLNSRNEDSALLSSQDTEQSPLSSQETLNKKKPKFKKKKIRRIRKNIQQRTVSNATSTRTTVGGPATHSTRPDRAARLCDATSTGSPTGRSATHSPRPGRMTRNATRSRDATSTGSPIERSATHSPRPARVTRNATRSRDIVSPQTTFGNSTSSGSSKAAGYAIRACLASLDAAGAASGLDGNSNSSLTLESGLGNVSNVASFNSETIQDLVGVAAVHGRNSSSSQFQQPNLPINPNVVNINSDAIQDPVRVAAEHNETLQNLETNLQSDTNAGIVSSDNMSFLADFDGGDERSNSSLQNNSQTKLKECFYGKREIEKWIRTSMPSEDSEVPAPKKFKVPAPLTRRSGRSACNETSGIGCNNDNPGSSGLQSRDGVVGVSPGPDTGRKAWKRREVRLFDQMSEGTSVSEWLMKGDGGSDITFVSDTGDSCSSISRAVRPKYKKRSKRISKSKLSRRDKLSPKMVSTKQLTKANKKSRAPKPRKPKEINSTQTLKSPSNSAEKTKNYITLRSSQVTLKQTSQPESKIQNVDTSVAGSSQRETVETDKSNHCSTEIAPKVNEYSDLPNEMPLNSEHVIWRQICHKVRAVNNLNKLSYVSELLPVCANTNHFVLDSGRPSQEIVNHENQQEQVIDNARTHENHVYDADPQKQQVNDIRTSQREIERDINPKLPLANDPTPPLKRLYDVNRRSHVVGNGRTRQPGAPQIVINLPEGEFQLDEDEIRVPDRPMLRCFASSRDEINSNSRSWLAPVFYPTVDEFENPFEFFNKILPYAANFGICKIIPPREFTPQCFLEDDMQFNVTNQYISRLFNRWGPAANEMCAIRTYSASQNVMFKKPPLYEGLEVSLPKLYHIVQRFGGLRRVISKKRWGRVAEEMRFSKSPNVEKKLDQIYVKYLLPYEALSQQERCKEMSNADKAWQRRNIKMIIRASNPLHRQKLLLGESDSSDDSSSDEESVLTKSINDIEECIQPGRRMQLNTFKKVATTVKEMHFPKTAEPTINEVEEQFWRYVLLRTDHMCINTASIDTGDKKHGFKTEGDPEYDHHPWNLKVLTTNKDNILRFLGPTLGVTVPTLHLGMMFSTSCWHSDPHGLPWIEYMHSGRPKIWYGISEKESDNFRRAVHVLCPTFSQQKSVWLPSEITMIPPNLLHEYNVSQSRQVQYPGEFVLVLPKAYTCSISTGLSVSESVYFATKSWLSYVDKIFLDVKDSCEPTMFSLEKHLIALARDPHTPPSVLREALGVLTNIVNIELGQRNALEGNLPTTSDTPVRVLKHPNSPYYLRDKHSECELCRTTLYLSKVIGLCNDDLPVCLVHGLHMIEQRRVKKLPPKHVELCYYYTEVELKQILEQAQSRLFNM